MIHCVTGETSRLRSSSLGAGNLSVTACLRKLSLQASAFAFTLYDTRSKIRAETLS